VSDDFPDPGAEDPNRRRWVDAAEHVATYRLTDGRIGHLWHDRPHLLLTTTGRRSGREHTVPLVYGRLPDAGRGGGPAGRLVVVASAGGAERHPAWYLNLVARPLVGVQLLDRTWDAAATTADGGLEDLAWQVMGRTWSGFTTYSEQTRRRIPVVVLEPRA
jgi:deazaflavin-dependent oxidoreductase (nitroreductase family)